MHALLSKYQDKLVRICIFSRLLTTDLFIQSPSRDDALRVILHELDGVPHLDVPLMAAADVPRLGLPGRAIAVLSKYVTGT